MMPTAGPCARFLADAVLTDNDIAALRSAAAWDLPTARLGALHQT